MDGTGGCHVKWNKSQGRMTTRRHHLFVKYKEINQRNRQYRIITSLWLWVKHWLWSSVEVVLFCVFLEYRAVRGTCIMKYCAATRKNRIMKFVYKWMDLESIMRCEMSHKGMDRCRMIELICGTSGKQNMRLIRMGSRNKGQEEWFTVGRSLQVERLRESS